MRLLVSCIPYDGGKSGISVYVREVVAALKNQGHELTLLCEPGVTIDIRHAAGDNGKSDVIQAPRWTRRAIFSMLWHLFALPFWIRRHRRDFDGFVICAANRRVCAWYPLPTTATVHDLANFHIPGKYSRLRMFYLAHILPFFAKRAQHLVAVSGATKTDMVKYWGCREDDVTVLYNGLSASTRLTTPNARPSSLLYISRIEHPGKNHLRLIEAYGRLPRTLAEAHPLVIAGADWKDAEVVHEAAAKSPHAGLIRFTGFVEDIDALWKDAGFYVFPSLFEGFGLSLIEAMARGVPCACSRNGSLGEIAADVAITFDPESVESITAAIERLLSEPAQEREARIARGLGHIKKFSWANHARGIAALIGGSADCPQAASRRVEGDAPCRTVNLFGIPVAKVTEGEAVDRIIDLAKSRHQQPTAFVATLNVDFVSNAVRCWPFGGNDELWGYLKNADLVTADGMPIVLLSKLLRNSLPERVTGADMVPAICRRCAEEGLSVYVLGGDREAVEEAFAKLGGPQSSAAEAFAKPEGPQSSAAEAFAKPGGPGFVPAGRDEARPSQANKPLKVVGIDPAFVKLGEDQPEIVERINAAHPDVLFVALGNPKQELWMGRNAAKLNVGAMIGIGGTFNFIAGRVKRAPRWVQKIGLEWIYRIIQEPGRLWKRYAYGLVKFSWLSLRMISGGFR